MRVDEKKINLCITTRGLQRILSTPVLIYKNLLHFMI